MTDSFVDELFDIGDDLATRIVYPVSRLVVDPERFTDDTQEPMADKGMGAVYTRTSHGRTLRDTPSDADRAELLKRYYEPHHQRLKQAVDTVLAEWGRCVILDCHSFPSVPLPYEEEQSSERPDICLGTDAFHTPDWLLESARSLFEGEGFSVAVNRPFSGTLVPLAYCRRETRVQSIMIELNRALYMDEARGTKSVQFASLRSRLGGVLVKLLDRSADVDP